MVIYVDVVVVINFVIDLFLLVCVDMLLRRHVCFWRIFFSSLFGALSTLLLFVVSGGLWMFFYKLLVSVFLVIIAYGYRGFDYFKDNLFWLYVISIILGGSLYLINDSVSLSSGGLIFSRGSLGCNIFLYFPVGAFVVWRYVRYVRGYRCSCSSYMDVCIYYRGLVIKDTGFVDTGNNIHYFSKAVILVNDSLIKGDVLFSYMPYKVVGGSGLLKVFKPDRVIVNGRDVKCYVGVSDVCYKGVNIILNKEII